MLNEQQIISGPDYFSDLAKKLRDNIFDRKPRYYFILYVSNYHQKTKC